MIQEILLDEQARLGKPNTVDFNAMIQSIKVGLVSRTQRVSGDLGISQFSIIRHLHTTSSKEAPEPMNCASCY